MNPEDVLWMHLEPHPSLEGAKPLSIKLIKIDGYLQNSSGTARILAQGGPYDINMKYEEFVDLYHKECVKLRNLIKKHNKNKV